MKLPSGRTIDNDSLLAAATMAGQRSYELESFGDAVSIVLDDLGDDCFKLNGTEEPFEHDDALAVIDAVRDIAGQLSDSLYDAENKWEATAKRQLAEKYPEEAEDGPRG